MGRMTRAKAAEVAEKLHVDEDAVLEMPDENVAANEKTETPKRDDRAPLGEIAPNSGSGHEDEVADMKKSTRSRKGGRKGAKGKKDNFVSSANGQTEAQDEEIEAAPAIEEPAVSPDAAQGVTQIVCEGKMRRSQ